MSLSDADLAKIADKVFFLKKPAPVKLSAPAITPALKTKIDSIVTASAFNDLGVGVADFTHDPSNPDTYLHNGDLAWRIGSSGKIAILLAAVQLLDDVREVQDLKLISTAKEYDDLFQLAKLWKKSKYADARDMANPAYAPRISTIIDVTKTPAEFIGPDAENPKGNDIFNRLPAGAHAGDPRHLKWELAEDFDFSERLWLCGALSDNVAATSCMSEIGVHYIKAVLRAYGLYDDVNKRGLLLADGYALVKENIPEINDVKPPIFRKLADPEYSQVTDNNKFFGKSSSEPGTASALIAYMVALMKDELVDPDHEDTRGITGCKIIRNNLARETPPKTHCFLAEAITSIGGVSISKQISKVGLLGKEDGESGPVDCEFSYVEVTGGPKFGVAFLGTNQATTTNLGKAIYNALK
jgi:hypothetical protein